MSTPPKWYYANANSEAVGPLSFEDLVKLRDAGLIQNETLVIEHGESAAEWKSLNTVLPTASKQVPTNTEQQKLVKIKDPTPEEKAKSMASGCGGLVTLLIVFSWGISQCTQDPGPTASTPYAQNAAHVMSKSEFRKQLGPLAQSGVVNWRKDAFIKVFGTPTRTQVIDNQWLWYYDCSDGMIQIELNMNPDTVGMVYGRINEY